MLGPARRALRRIPSWTILASLAAALAVLPGAARAQFATFPDGDGTQAPPAPQAPQGGYPNGGQGGNGQGGNGQGGSGQGNPLVGAWSWQEQANNGSGTIYNTVAYGPNGSYVLAYRTPNGILGRVWGTYRFRQAGPNQVEVASHRIGYLPQQICVQSPGAAPNCQAARVVPPDDTMVVTFAGPDAIQFGTAQAMRDPSPMLMNIQVPATAVIPGAPSYNGGGGGGGGGGDRSIERFRERMKDDDDLQQRRICALNGGTLVVVRGRLQCV